MNAIFKFFFATLLFCGQFLSIPAQAQTLAPATDDGIFFRISGGGLAEPSFILGTVHTIPGDFVRHIPHFDEAVCHVRQFVFEKDLNRSIQQTGIAEMVDSATYASLTLRNDSLFHYENADIRHNPYAEEMDSATYAIVCRVMNEDFSMPDFYRNSPLQNVPLLQQRYFEKIKNIAAKAGVRLRRANCPLDVFVCDSIARPRGADIAELDTTWVLAQPDRELSTFLENEATGMNDRHFYAARFFVPSVQYYWLLLSISQKYFDNYFHYKGKACMEPMQGELEQKIFAERNTLWMRRLPALLHRAPSLVVVGLGHLFDRDNVPGILSSLQSMGYTIESLTP